MSTLNRIEHRLYRRSYQTFPPQLPGPWLSLTPHVGNNLNSVTKGPNVPDFRRRIQLGSSATTSLEGEKYSSTLPPYGYFMVETKSALLGSKTLYEYQGSMCYANVALEDPSIFSIDSVKRAATTQFVQRCIEAQTALRSLVTLGEFGETSRMVNNRARRIWTGIYDHLGGLKKRLRGVRGHRRRSKVVADSWLEHSFGWAPLVGDIEGGITALYRLTSYRAPRVPVRAKSSYDDKLLTSVEDQLFQRLGFRVITTRSRKVGYMLYGSIGLQTGALASIRQETGFSFNEVVPTLWELIPYSSIVDYFTNLGNIIDAVTFNRSSLLWSNAGELRQSSLEAISAHFIIPPPAGHTVVDSIVPAPKTFSRSRRQVKRYAFTGSLVPSFGFKIPGLGLKWLNLAALLVSRNRIRSELS